ncbi:MAG: helix-turn-helix domain-containing protein [Bacteroidales bacterium]|nr:helix-turn-helix domain-containing protein [Bacteroidales bacterium]
MAQETSPYYEMAYHFANYTDCSLFLTGKAGTGKTTFLKKLKENSKKEMAIVAPTGVAAVNAGGVTIHSFFQLPLSPFIPTEGSRKDLVSKIKMNSARRKVLANLEMLVIDEISMVRADLLDEIDTVLRYFRYRRDEPFGGVQMLFIGDMYQLSPVCGEMEWQLLSEYYSSIYFFDSMVIRNQPPVYIEFDNIFRQSNLNFIQLLNEVRNNKISEESFKCLQQLYKPDFKSPKDDTYIILTTHNYKADSINADELMKLRGATKKFKAEIQGDYPEKSYPTELELEFKVGAKVMFLRNDRETPRRYFNGKIGEIVNFDDEGIYVKCQGEEPVLVVPETWENISYKTNPETKQITETVLGTFNQYPLRLAWAITIHKSQGLTFDKAIIDAGQAFTAGQVYVALSRCRSLEGVVLLSKINRNSLNVDENIIRHSNQKLPIEILNNRLDVSKKEYREKILFALFDFQASINTINRLTEFVKEKGTSFNFDTLAFLTSIHGYLSNAQKIASRFQQELKTLLSSVTVDEQKLQERITSAINYFSKGLQAISTELKKSPATTDSKANALRYNDDLGEIFASIEEKLHLFRNTKDRFTVEQYFIAKETLVLPSFPVNAFAGANLSKKTTAKFPALFHQLMDYRRSICEKANIPLYSVVSTQGLIELATFLPETPKDLLKLSGFGPATVSKYGQQFLEIVLLYCNEHDLNSLMHEKIESKKSKKSKKDPALTKPKEDTKKITYDLYKQGFTVEEIAQKRNYAGSTIKSHLAHYVKLGELPLTDFVTVEQQTKILEVMKTKTAFKDIYSALHGEIGYPEIDMVTSLLTNKDNE